MRETSFWSLTAFSPFTLGEQRSYGVAMAELFQYFPPTSSAPSCHPLTPISANHVYKTSASKSQFKWTHPFVQLKVASGVAPCETHRPELHMAGSQMWTRYDLFMTTMCICCPVPAGCGFTCLPQSGMTYLLTVSHFRYCISILGKQRWVTGGEATHTDAPNPAGHITFCDQAQSWPNVTCCKGLPRTMIFSGEWRSSCWNDWPCGVH